MSDLCPVCGTTAMNFQMDGDDYRIVCDNCGLSDIVLDTATILFDDDQKNTSTPRFPELVRLNKTYPRIRHKCANCSNNVLIALTDSVTLVRSYICSNCGTIYTADTINTPSTSGK